MGFVSSLHGVVTTSPSNFISQMNFILSSSLKKRLMNLFLIKLNTIKFIPIVTFHSYIRCHKPTFGIFEMFPILPVIVGD